eukprot:Filipodium_phascolosomae@DN2101_c0_g1_i2.p1
MASRFSCAIDPLWNKLNLVEKVAKIPMRGMTLQRLWKAHSNPDALIKNAEWVRDEMSVRLAHRLHDFHRLPYAVAVNPEFQKVYQLFLETFEAMYTHPPVTDVWIKDQFILRLQDELQKHNHVVDIVGRGVRQIKINYPDLDLEKFLERFFYSRIARRVMSDHLIMLQYPPGQKTIPLLILRAIAA